MKKKRNDLKKVLFFFFSHIVINFPVCRKLEIINIYNMIELFSLLLQLTQMFLLN